jgi:hypothetical protein
MMEGRIAMHLPVSITRVDSAQLILVKVEVQN